MRVLLQRVNNAQVTVEGRVVGRIERGLLLLVGLGQGDDESRLKPAAEKVVNMRIFPDDKGRFHFSTLDIEGEILAVSQFTLYADTSKGRRPDFFSALEPTKARELFEKFVSEIQALGVKRVETGEFGAEMKVALENDGPVTIMLEL